MTLSVTARRRLPSVETLLQHDALAALLAALPRVVVVESVRVTLAAERQRLGKGGEPPAPDVLAEQAARHAQAAARPSLIRVLNGTGVVLHTNLGRAPLPEAARHAIDRTARGYCSLELDLDTG